MDGEGCRGGGRDRRFSPSRTRGGGVPVITAGNFPVAVPSWYLVPALLTGNAVVWKPAEYAAASAQALYELFVRAGLPADVLRLVQAGGAAPVKGLSAALDARVVGKGGFTWSPAVRTPDA